MNILRRKSFDDLLAHTQEKKLNKALGAFDITLMGLGIIIGTGYPSFLQRLLVLSSVWLIRNWLHSCPYLVVLILTLMRPSAKSLAGGSAGASSWNTLSGPVP